MTDAAMATGDSVGQRAERAAERHPDLAEQLMRERRARLGAERLLAQKQAELAAAHRKLNEHAQALSVEVIEKREEVAEVRSDLAAAESRTQTAERRLWTLLATVPDGFAVFDASGNLVIANTAWLEPFDGLAVAAPGFAYADIIRAATDEGMFDIGAESRAEWCERMLERWRREHPEPVTVRLWNGRFVRLVDRRGEGGEVVSLALDITPQMRDEARLRSARLRAEAANRAKGAFLANMSHELRTPMNGVLAMAELLGETGLDEEQRSAIEMIRTSGTTLLAIIDDILDLAKLDARKMTLHPVPFDLELLCHDLVQLMGPLARRKGLRLAVEYDPLMPADFMGDRERLGQILTNLIGNALKFTEKGEVAVRVEGTATQAGHWSVSLSVKDTGIGVPRDMLRHIFGEFTQMEGERNRRHDGSGLGLSITERLTKLMGGEITVESETRKGSCFVVRLELPEVSVTGGGPVLPPPRPILLIEPDPVGAARLRDRLRALGMSVVVRETASADPAAMLASSLPDGCGVVLCAHDTGEENLEGIASALAAHAPRVPLITIADGVGARGVAGVAGHLVRPILRRSLVDMLNALPWPPQDLDERAWPRRAMRVLAAEDNQINRQALAMLLRTLDIELRFASNGVEAVSVWRDWRPDLVFMDISMPEMDGKEATAVIRSEEAGTDRHTQICALTAHALDGDESDVLSAGLDGYLTKPLRKAALVERLVAACPPGCRDVVRALADPAAPPEGKHALRGDMVPLEHVRVPA